MYRLCLVFVVLLLLSCCNWYGPESYCTLGEAIGFPIKNIHPQPQIYPGMITAIRWPWGTWSVFQYNSISGWSEVRDDEAFTDKVIELIYLHIEEFKPHTLQEEPEKLEGKIWLKE